MKVQGVLTQMQPEPGAGGEPGQEVQIRLTVLHRAGGGRPDIAGLDGQPNCRGELGGDVGHRDIAPHPHGARQTQSVQGVVTADADREEAVGPEAVTSPVNSGAGDPATVMRSDVPATMPVGAMPAKSSSA